MTEESAARPLVGTETVPRPLVDESPELSSAAVPGWAHALGKAFPALEERNYRLYFFGQLISQIGTWLQIVAQGWLVLQLTNSPFLIGLVAAAATLPSLLLSLPAGVLVDRVPRRTLLMATQTASAVLAIALGILTVARIVTVPEIVLLAFLLGTVSAVDAPARQAFVVEILPRPLIPSGIALNSGSFNAARVIGPGTAGFLIAWVGTGGAFLLNGVSYVAVLAALRLMRLPARRGAEAPRAPVWMSIREGVRYSLTHPVIRVLLLLTGVVSVFGWSYTTLMPLIARNTFHQGAAGLGYLYAANGFGAVTAAVVVSLYSGRIRSVWFIIGGNTLFAAALLLFSLTSSFRLALVCLFFVGLGLLMQFSMMNTTIQNAVRDDIRGRVMSIYLLIFIGLFPLGNLEIGYVAEKLSEQTAMRIGAAIVFVCGLVVFLYRNRIRAQVRSYEARRAGTTG